MNKEAVLIVDDDRIIREQLEKELQRNYFQTMTAATAAEATGLLQEKTISIVLLDIKLTDGNGLDLLETVRSVSPNSQVIVITGFGSQDVAIQALRRGAIDYLEKPLDMEQLYASLGRAQEKLAESSELSLNHTVLVADDDGAFAERIARLLTKEGYRTFTARSAAEGLAVIREHKVDVVVTDIAMGDSSGIDLLREAKGLYRDIEGIMVTGHNDQELAAKALRAGAIDYIVKPIDIEMLLMSIKRAIERISLNRTRLYRNRELKISAEIITKMNEELERRIEERTKELSRMQSQLFQTSKLATLGEMSAGLAHEMNQPLGGISLVIKNFRKLKERGKLSDAELLAGFDDVDTSVKRMTRVIQHIRTFARQDTLSFAKVQVHETIHSALSLLGEQLRLHSIEVVTDLPSDSPVVSGEPYQLEQVWINLISNARDAMDEKEKNRTKGAVAGPYQKKLIIAIRRGPDAKVLVEFADNGAGIPASIRAKVFEPFFTTKEVGKAMGLGLSISYGIIENHQGTISFESAEMAGTTLRVTLPEEKDHGIRSDY
jgi:signal transduction histidine kinase